jgi:hypothetical protein
LLVNLTLEIFELIWTLCHEIAHTIHVHVVVYLCWQH